MDHHHLTDRGWGSPGGPSSEESHAAVMATPDNKKTCADCGTSKTPLWRGGPTGPKSLCNACGIRSRKKRRAILGLVDRKVKRSDPGRTSDGTGTGAGTDRRRSVELGESLKRKILAIGKHVAMPRKKIGEEEQAAMLLMALSYGCLCLNDRCKMGKNGGNCLFGGLENGPNRAEGCLIRRSFGRF